MNSRHVANAKRLLVVGIPLAFAALLAFHPVGDGQIYGALHDHSTRWQVVHVGQLFFIGLLAVAVYLLVDGLEGRLATVCRVALLPFVLFYGAWESYTGIGTGELVRHAHDVPAEDQAVAGAMIQSYFESPVAGNISILSGLGGTSWLVSVVAAALAIRKTGAPRSIWILFGLAAVAFFVGHPPPTGPIGLVLFAVAAAWFGWRGAPLADAGGDVLPEPAAVAN